MNKILLLLALAMGTVTMAQANTTVRLNTYEWSSIVAADSTTGQGGPSTWRGEGGGLRDSCCVSMRAEMYPNPAMDMVTIRLKDSQEFLGIHVMDIRGREMVLEATRPRNGVIQFSVENWNPGMYMVQLRTSEQVETTPLKVE